MTFDTYEPTLNEMMDIDNAMSYLNLSEGRTAYIIGNGQSRIGLDLTTLNGDIWGCNALYRDYEPDYLTIDHTKLSD